MLHFTRGFAAAALLLAGTLPAAAASGTPAADLSGTRDLGAAPSSTVVSVALTLRYRHADQLDALVAAQSNPRSPSYRHFLSSAQFDAYFAPSQDEYARVAGALAGLGFRVAHTYANRTLIDAEAPVRTAERAFRTVVHAVSQPGQGIRYANVTPAEIPRQVADVVDNVIGLDDIVRGRFMYEFGRPAFTLGHGVGAPLRGPDGGFGPLAIANGFDFPVQHGFGGAGEAVANVAGDVADSDLAAFQKYFGIKRRGKLLRTKVQHPSIGADVEATLDVETMASLDPDADVHLYMLSNPVGKTGLDAYNQIVTDNSVVAVNSSFGVCENQAKGYGKSANKIITQGEALGISWLASTGDGGASQCGGPQIIPADLPSVTGAGGTSLVVNAKGMYVSQSAWSGGGGGISALYPLPSFQQGVSGLGSTTFRNLPDISFPADPNTGASFYFQGGWQGPIGGTSWSSPTFVALQAEIDQMTGKAGGFINPTIYGVFASSQYQAFYDVTTGSNGYPATQGYDNATGIGSAIGYTLGTLE